MACPNCGGDIGPHSDICLECDYDCDESQFTDLLWQVIIAVIIFCVFALCFI